MQNKKGQGSLEYLLIIGGGILVAVVIIGAIVSLAGTGTGGTKRNVSDQTCHTYITQTACIAATISGATNPSSPEACTGADTGGFTVPNPCGWKQSNNPGLQCFLCPESTVS
jgi:hypothetical protein